MMDWQQAALLVLCGLCVAYSETIILYHETSNDTDIASLCPSLAHCHCLFKDGQRIIDCSSRELPQLPYFGSLAGKEFDAILLNNNRISRIAKGAFAGLNVRKMNLNDNAISTVSDRAFEDVPMLEELTMENCQLRNTPVGLNPLSNMVHLELQHNKIHQINSKTFENMKQLEFLDIGHNPIGITAPFDAFNSLGKMKTLHMADCGLYSIPQDAIGHMSHLINLDLKDNHIWKISSDFFSRMEHLRSLDLSNNPLEINSREKIFEALRKLKVLKLSGCKCEERKLHSHIIENLKELRVLQLASCDIHQLEAGVFSHLHHLVDLDLSGNHFILKTDIFHGVTDTVEKLHLNDAGLAVFPYHIYEPFSRLKHAYLRQNKIEMLSAQSFRTFIQSGVHVYLENNKIKKISSKVLQWSPRPINLHLQNNYIRNLHFIADDPCRFQLATIHLNGNNISCDCDIFKAAQMKAFLLLGTCTRPAEYEGLRLSWRPNKTLHVDHFMEHNVTSCDLPQRHYQRYECTCKRWMPWDANEVCGPIGQAPPTFSIATTLFSLLLISCVLLAT